MRDCDLNPAAGPYLLSGQTPGSQNAGQTSFIYQGALQTVSRFGSSWSSTNLMDSYTPTCAPKLLIMATGITGGVSTTYYEINNMPNVAPTNSVHAVIRLSGERLL